MKFETSAVHCDTDVDPTSGAIVKPVTMSVTFERDADGGYHRRYFYSSKGNPNRNGLESSMATLEGGSDAVAFASGCSAISAVLRALTPGDHVEYFWRNSDCGIRTFQDDEIRELLHPGGWERT